MHSAIIPRDSAKEFAEEAAAAGFKHIEEKTLSVSRAWATSDIAPSATQHASFEVLTGTASSLVERTQNPPLSDGKSFPAEMRIALFALACVVRLGDLGTIVQAQSMQADLDRSVVTLSSGGLDNVQLRGPEFMDYGPVALIGNDTTAPNEGRFTTAPRIFRTFGLRRVLGKEQTISLVHSIGRSTAWGVAFTADYLMPALIARKVV
jgi:hypothetical protein